MLTIAPQANADGIYERGYKYIFSVLPPASNYLKGLVDMGLTLSPQPHRLAVLIRDDPFGIAAGEGAAKYAASKGYEVVFKEKFPANATDVSTILTRVKATNPDAMLASTLFQDSVLLTRQAKDLQFAPKLSGVTAGPAMPDFVSSLGRTPSSSTARNGGCRASTTPARCSAAREGLRGSGPQEQGLRAIPRRLRQHGRSRSPAGDREGGDHRDRGRPEEPARA